MVGTLQFTPTFDGAQADTALANAGGNRPFEVLSVDGETVKNYQDVAMGLGDRLGESGEIVLEYSIWKAVGAAKSSYPSKAGTKASVSLTFSAL